MLLLNIDSSGVIRLLSGKFFEAILKKIPFQFLSQKGMYMKEI
jgi:hypothetical protein